MRRKPRRTILFSAFMLLSLACSFITQFSSQQATPGSPAAPTTEVPVDLPDPAPTNSAEAQQNVAGMIYDALAAGQDLKPYITGVMTAFGVPPLDETQLSEVEERYKQGLPFLFAPQVAEMADTFNGKIFVSLDSFIAGANSRGARQEGTHLPLTREYLTQKFSSYTGKAQYEAGQALPAFVLALSSERARRFPPAEPDPLWGDGLLDPLQAALLIYSVSYSGAGPLPAEVSRAAAIAPLDADISYLDSPVEAALIPGSGGSNPIIDFIIDQLRDVITGEIQDWIDIPLDPLSAAQATICASLLLYGHKLQVTNTPHVLYHRDGEKPWQTQVEVLLTFQDDYWSNYLPIDRWMLENLATCKLPHRGPVAGKPLTWSVSRGLSGHGEFAFPPPQTDDNGRASVYWVTVSESTPKSLRTPAHRRETAGGIIVRAGDLVSDWSGIELIVGELRDTGNTGEALLMVVYYVTGAYKAAEHPGVPGYSGVICDLGKPFTLKAEGPSYHMKIEFAPSSAEAGALTMAGTLDMGESVNTVTGDGTYTVSSSNDIATQLVLDVTRATAVNNVLGGGTESFQMSIDLVPLDTDECGESG